MYCMLRGKIKDFCMDWVIGYWLFESGYLRVESVDWRMVNCVGELEMF